jgi:hypothetical protein
VATGSTQNDGSFGKVAKADYTTGCATPSMRNKLGYANGLPPSLLADFAATQCAPPRELPAKNLLFPLYRPALSDRVREMRPQKTGGSSPICGRRAYG